MRVLVTGASGYIGSHTCAALKEAGHEVIALDNKVSTNDVPYNQLLIRDVTVQYIDRIFYDTVVHLASLISVEESTLKPSLYVKNNIQGTYKTLLNYKFNNFIFASTAAAFNPISPYAQTKLVCESLVKEMAPNYTIFRFFNVAGSDGVRGQIGPSTHLIRIAAETAAGKRGSMVVYGDEWATRDGTCVRDYIHVQDLVDGIVKAVNDPQNTDYECVGTGNGYTVSEVIETMKRVTGVDFNVLVGPNRSGDVGELLIPSWEKRSDLIKPTRTLEEMCLSAYKYELNRKGGRVV